MLQCLKYASEYDTACHEKRQCTEWLDSAQKSSENIDCRNNRCICDEGYRWFQGECRAYVGKGQSCSSSVDCYDDMDQLALTCKDNTCQCSAGYYEREHDCRISSHVWEECAIKSDCKPFSLLFLTIESTCELGVCVRTDSDQLRSCSTAECDSAESDYFEVQDKQIIADYVLREDPPLSSCKGLSNVTTSDECDSCEDAFWFKSSSCVCEPGFFAMDDFCVAELGMKNVGVLYKQNKDCPIKPGKLKDGVCYCRNYWFNDYTNRNCIKTTLEVTKSCMDDGWCQAMGPHAFCNSTTGQCECNRASRFDETGFYCEVTDESLLQGKCLNDTKSSQCPVNEECRDQECACVENFERIDGLCLPTLGGSCSFRNCSHIEDATCSSNPGGDNTCQCTTGYVSNTTHCFKVAERLYDNCVVDMQCASIDHAICGVATSANATQTGCICAESFVDRNATCYAQKSYGSTCSTRRNCTAVLNDSFECRNSLCQCPVSKTYKDGYCSAALVPSAHHHMALLIAVFAWFGCKF
ncbi:prion-like-(Q/N-rich) domain-bearing protein 25 isoform X2 [Cylas formicarius]|nr:prion-like-(Q/N-rich) domain-bearing protein 25 isoform X2 [Cylas formicarius]XP_060533293.1 prion-like-(Q/N-rich) domain-bearing protein 25 isoform X2 [Cylas formicarius]XP_060533294.1 prion-like-(Q/N-rich) domain-bearing protein 25 isoform X2 [Cylas formicarius]XP_060533295.1 prion-like-(Q/N-rich) domain-bearing protein 25 isoform X2 [Cylas formicarius]